MITELAQVHETRLTWPEGKPRAAHRKRSAFKGAEVDREQREIEAELARWGVRRFIISRNNQRIYAGDPGAAVWWETRKGELRVLASDSWDKLADNLRAICKTLDAMRALERWGAYSAEQAAEGAKLQALPPPEHQDWRKLFGLAAYQLPRADLLTLAERRYRDHSREAAGNETRQRTLNLAIEAARVELGSGARD